MNLVTSPVRAYIALGSNLDKPEHQVTKALGLLDTILGTRHLRSSRLYTTAPWGMIDQPCFINAVTELDTTLSAHELLAALLDIEQTLGRVRCSTRWGPRIIDLDLLLYGSLVLRGSQLTLPHPHLHERAFVLMPLAELAPDLDVPGRGQVSDLLARVDTSGCVAVAPSH